MTPVCADAVKTNFFALPSNVGVSPSAGKLEKEESDAFQEMLTQSMTMGRHYWQTGLSSVSGYRRCMAEPYICISV